MAAVPVVNTRILKRAEDLEREVPPIWCCGHWVLPKHLAQAVLGMDTMKRQRPAGLAVLLHWKGYLVVREWGIRPGVHWTPPSGGANPDPASLAARGGGLNPEKMASGFAVDFGGENLGNFENPTFCRFWATLK